MHHRDDFDGGDLLALFGLDEEPQKPRQPAEPQPAGRSHEAWSTLADEPPASPRHEEPPRRSASRRRAAGDLRDLSSDDIVRAIVLADALGPPPGRRGGRRR